LDLKESGFQNFVLMELELEMCWMESKSLPNQEICTLTFPFLEQKNLRAWH